VNAGAGHKLDQDDFELFGLPRQFALNRSALDARWKDMQAQVHPDRHAAGGASTQRVAMQWSVRVNEAYRRLRDPLTRAAYLCRLHGVEVDLHGGAPMPGVFLVQQMQWREALDEARDSASIEALADAVAGERARRLAEIASTIDERRDWSAAAEQVKALMFVERIARDVETRLDALND
jgi:molecular chaperone HscB